MDCDGFLGKQCAEGYDCIDVPGDDCDPDDGVSNDCIGECTMSGFFFFFNF